MSKVKKVFAFVMALAMTLAFVTPAFAATIQTKHVIEGETYAAYKILNYTDNGKTGDDRAASYYLTATEYASLGATLEDAGFDFTESSDGTQYWVNNADTLDAAAVASYLGSHTSDLGTALGTATAIGNASGEANFENLPTGYYFVTSSAGSLCALHENTDIATVVEKNTIPQIDKKQKGGSVAEYTDEALDLNIGDTVNYQVVITDGVGTDAAIVMKDTLSAGLTYTANSLKINGAAVADNADNNDWKVTVSGQTITINFTAAYVANLDDGDTITVTYDATINKDAIIDAPVATTNADGTTTTGATNDNTVTLDYSNQHSEDKTNVQTYDFKVLKTDGSAFLDGAEFKLYDAPTGGNQILLSSDSTGYYKDNTGSADTTIDINSADGVNVRGLKPGTYYLEEVVVPGGYNKLDQREVVTVTTGATAAVEITVVNNKGTVMPSTGGIGTTIFYIVGGVMVAGAVVFLLTKRRMAGSAE